MAVLHDLPTELLLKIFEDIDYLTIRECRAISRFFRSLIDESIDIQYQVALGAAGYADGPQSPITTSQRLKKLVHHQSSWKTLTPQRSDRYEINSSPSIYELYGGIYASGINSDVGTASTHGLELIEFPSLLRNMDEGHAWKINDVGFDIEDFGMDPDHNLLVAMEDTPRRQTPTDNPPLRVHLLTLREEEAKPHPLTVVPTLQYQPQAWSGRYIFWVQVVGDVLAVLFMPSRLLEPFCANELVVWKWKTGELITTIRFERTGVESFSFLSNDTILVPCVVSSGELEGNDGVRAELRLYKLLNADGGQVAALLATYLLLPFKEGVVSAIDMKCRADPSPWVQRPRTAAQRGDQRDDDNEKMAQVVWPAHGAAPFAPASSDRIVVLSMTVQLHAPGQFRRSYTGFMKAESLLKLWLTASDLDGVVHWQRWGREHTRFVQERADTESVCYVYGMKYCRLILNNQTRTRLRLMDFNDAGLDAMLSREMAPVGPSSDAQEVVKDDGDGNWETDPDSGDEDAEAEWGTLKDAVPDFSHMWIRDRKERKRCARRRVAFHASYFHDPVLFTEPLETALRFRWRTKDFPQRFASVMIDDEHVIGIRNVMETGHQTVEVFTL